MKILTTLGHKVDQQVLENEVSAAYKNSIDETWKARYQLVLTHVHRCNADELTIRTFKAHFLSILDGFNTRFPGYLWDTLLLQVELMPNI